MKNDFFVGFGWSKRQWWKFCFIASVFFVIVPILFRWMGFSGGNTVLWSTGLVVLAYTIETQGKRLEMLRQTEIDIQPLLIARVERRQWRGGEYKNVVILQNIGRGSALFVQPKDIYFDEAAGGRFVARFERVDYIEAGKDTIADVTWRFEAEGEEPSKSMDFIANFNPQTARKGYDVTISYEDINGQKRELVVRMGKGGIRLLSHGKVTS